MEKSSTATFLSPFFKIEADEDQKTNPGIFGRHLAQWIASQLRARGVSTKAMIAEDWGWCVPVVEKPVRVCVAVSSVGEAPIRWQIFAFAERTLIEMFRRSVDLKMEVQKLQAQLAEVLQAVPEVSELQWD